MTDIDQYIRAAWTSVMSQPVYLCPNGTGQVLLSMEQQIEVDTGGDFICGRSGCGELISDHIAHPDCGDPTCQPCYGEFPTMGPSSPS